MDAGETLQARGAGHALLPGRGTGGMDGVGVGWGHRGGVGGISGNGLDADGCASAVSRLDLVTDLTSLSLE